MLLLLPLELAPPFLGLAFLLLLLLLSEPFGFLLALGGFLFGLRFFVGLVFRIAYWGGCNGRGRSGSKPLRRVRVMHGAIVLGANADGGADALAVDDQGGAGEGAGRLGVGVLGSVENPVLATLKDAGALFVAVAP